MNTPRMDEKTRRALEASIEKWKRNAVATKPIMASVLGDSCPLCHVFCKSGAVVTMCSGCPVSERTGKPNCDGSPWYAAYTAHYEWKRERGAARRDVFHEAARAEVAFLESLREKEEG